MFCMTGGTAPGEVSVWSLEKAICYEVYRAGQPDSRERVNLRDYELRNLDDEKPDKPLERAAEAELVGAKVRGEAIAVFGAQTSIKDPEAQHAFLVSGGPDGRVRFWDCERLEGCRVVNGLEGEAQPAYQFSQLSLDTRVCTERSVDTSAGGQGVESSPVSGGKGRAADKSGSNGKPPSRYESIRASARNLLRKHLDLVTDVAVLERPFGMVVSADRSGMVFVHQ
jgi:phosphoinositide-3-kinase regulatory subunit 4